MTKQEKIQLLETTYQGLGMNKKEFAKNIRVSYETVTKWSSNKVEIPNMAIKLFEIINELKDYQDIKQIIIKYSNDFL